jgi:hypothetical protein
MDILLTGQSGGDWSYYPRLQTAIKALRAKLSDSRPLLLDMGGAGSNSDVACLATENRAPYIVLDGMGYTAAIADDLAAAHFEQVQGLLQMSLILPGRVWQLGDCEFPMARDPHLSVAVWRDGLLALPYPPKGTIFHLRLNEGRELELNQPETFEAPSLPPDPSISGVVEFVLEEARYYQRKGGAQN